MEVFDSHRDVLAYERAVADERILVVANLGDGDIVHPVHRAEPAAVSTPAIEVTMSALRLPPHSAAALRLL